jgi:hypothetical protein
VDRSDDYINKVRTNVVKLKLWAQTKKYVNLEPKIYKQIIILKINLKGRIVLVHPGAVPRT